LIAVNAEHKQEIYTAHMTGANTLTPAPEIPVYRLSSILGILLLLAIPAHIDASEPCAPFVDGKVNADVLAAMRTAAHRGRLYRIVPGSSQVGFCVRYFPMQEFRGTFTQLVGGLALPENIDEHGQALLLIQTTSLEPSNPALAPMVHSYQFMDTERFPEILFIGHAFQWVNGQHAHLFGDITLHGRTQPVVFEMDITVRNDPERNRPGHIHLTGNGQIRRSHFDMRNYPLLVSDTVHLCLDVELVPWGH
jgi:polyisoprenoid-binding protein YceI